MTYPQGQPMTPYSSQPAPARTAGKRPRGWHLAAAITVVLFVGWFIVSMLATTCPTPKTANPAPSSSGSSSSSSAECAVYGRGHDAARKICEQRVSRQAERQTEHTYDYAKKSNNPACGVAESGIGSILMLGQLIGIIVTGILGWKRRKTYTAYRRSLFAVDDYERRVPPGTEGYVDLATHQMAAQAAANASTEMFMNRSYWFAPSGAETDARIDAIRATGARATNAAQQIQMSQYAGDEPMDDLAAPDLGGDGDTTSDTPTDADDDWMSGVDSNDSDW
ncbi:hypothetical protein [Mycobacteroides abscessus]|uniref:hypothetical protein n=1 Tax=Mycobacteroides abscessus TaxID=36809 RepID=UPI0013000234|nr:hypothetical protein [Mycobacteroides abscessus]